MAESILKLKVDSQEYEGKIKRAAAGIQHLDSDLRKAGKTFADCDKEQVEFIRQLGNMETVSKTAKGKLGELSAAFTDLKIKYNAMSDAEKKSDAGRALSSSLEQIKNKANATRQELQGITNELNNGSLGKNGGMSAGLGNLNGMLGQLGSQLGIDTSMLSAFSAGSLTAATGVGAVAMAIGASTKALADYNRELARQDQITSFTTGLKGADADSMTDAARSISKVYGTDFREVINAANVLMTQFGKSGDEAIQLIKRGMQGMIQGDGPKLLQLIQQYAPSFRDAGIEASQLVAIIQNSEGGLFTAENMNAIVMGIKNVRLMKDTTKKALQEIGVDAKTMSQKLNDGTMSVFDALKEISSQLENVGSGSQAAGQVMQDIFGRQGTAAGTNLAKAIANLNLNLEETALQTGEIGKAMADLEIATNNLENSLRDTFEVDNIDTMTTKIETQLTKDLTELISLLGELKTIFMSAFGSETVSAIGTVLEGVWGLTKEVLYLGTGILEFYRIIKAFTGIEIGGGGGSGWVDKMKQTITEHMTNPQSVLPEVTVIYNPFKGGGGHRGHGGGGKKTEKTEEQIINENIKKLTEEYVTASEERRKAIQKEIQDLEKQNEAIKKLKEEARGIDRTDYSMFEIKTPMATNVGGFKTADDLLETIKANVAFSVEEEQRQMLTNLIQEAVINGLEVPQGTVNEILQRMFDGGVVHESLLNGLVSNLEEQISAKTGQNFQFDKGSGKFNQKKEDTNKDKDKKEEKSVSQGVSQLAGSMNQMVSGIEQLGIDVPEDIKGVVSGIQGVTTILTAIASVVSAIEVIVGATSFIPFFANGGVVPHAAGGLNVVPGTHFSGDVTPIMADAGEVVLNRAQTNTLAGMLENGMMQRIVVEGIISGENIRLAARNNNLRTGRGEYVTTRKM